MQKIREHGVPLAELVGGRPYRGVLTGFNEAFLIDDATRAALIRDDPACADIIKPYLRGQDIKRWSPAWQGLWMIVLKSSADFDWPWSAAGENAESVFARTYPSLYGRMKALEGRLIARQDKGRCWWELRSCDYYAAFEQPKILYQEIQFHPQYAFSDGALYGNNKVFLLPTADLYLLAVLNSPLMWWHNWRYLPHMKDEALNPAGFRMETLPIAAPTPNARREVEKHAGAALELTRDSQDATSELLHWLRLELAVERPGQRLDAFANLSGDDFVAEVRKRRPKGSPRLTPGTITELIDTHRHYAKLEQQRAGKLRALERRLSDLVIQAYGLTNDEVELLWRTAPPRMPLIQTGRAQ